MKKSTKVFLAVLLAATAAWAAQNVQGVIFQGDGTFRMPFNTAATTQASYGTAHVGSQGELRWKPNGGIDVAIGSPPGAFDLPYVSNGVSGSDPSYRVLQLAGGGTGATDASGVRSAIGLVIGTNVQAYDADLTTLGAGGSSARSFLGLAIGTDIQAYDADLTTLGAGGSGARSFLGLAIGTDVQAFNARLADIAAVSPTDGRILMGNATNLVMNQPTTMLDYLGSTRGTILYRGASGWTTLDPGTSGYVLKSNGPGADPSYAVVAGGGESLAATLAIGSTTSGHSFTLTSGDSFLIDAVGHINHADGTITVGGTNGGASTAGKDLYLRGGDGNSVSGSGALFWSQGGTAAGVGGEALIQAGAGGSGQIGGETAFSGGPGNGGLSNPATVEVFGGTAGTTPGGVLVTGDTSVVGSLSITGDLSLASTKKIFLNATTIAGGSGSPEGVVTAPVSSIWLRSNGGTASTLYVKESGSGNTGWVAVGAVTGYVPTSRTINTTSPLSGGGDLTGDLTLTLGTIPESKGGTNQTTYALGDILYSSATNTLSKLAGNTTSTRKFLRQVGNGSVSAAPAWDTLVSGDIPDLSGTYQPLDTQLTSLAGLSYSSNALKTIRVNAGETGFELATTSGGGETLAQTLAIGADANGVAITGLSDLTANAATNMTINGANGGSGVVGKNVTVTAGNGNASSGSGGKLTNRGGSTAGAGGNSELLAGAGISGQIGGSVTLTGGNGNVGGGTGHASSATIHGGGSSGTGGVVEFNGGDGDVAKDGGSCSITAGHGDDSTSSGAAISLGPGSGTDAGGSGTFTGGNGTTGTAGGGFTITCGQGNGSSNYSQLVMHGGSADGTGGQINIQGGQGDTGLRGGNIIINAGGGDGDDSNSAEAQLSGGSTDGTGGLFNFNGGNGLSGVSGGDGSFTGGSGNGGLVSGGALYVRAGDGDSTRGGVETHGKLRIFENDSGASSPASISVLTTSATVTLSSGASVNATNLIPAGCVCVGVTVTVNTDVTTSGATNTFNVGSTLLGTNAYGASVAGSSGTTTTSSNFTANPVMGWSASAQNVVLDAAGAETFTGGEVQVFVHYIYCQGGSP